VGFSIVISLSLSEHRVARPDNPESHAGFRFRRRRQRRATAGASATNTVSYSIGIWDKVTVRAKGGRGKSQPHVGHARVPQKTRESTGILQVSATDRLCQSWQSCSKFDTSKSIGLRNAGSRKQREAWGGFSEMPLLPTSGALHASFKL